MTREKISENETEKRKPFMTDIGVNLEKLVIAAGIEDFDEDIESDENEEQQMSHKGVPFGIIDGIPLVERQEILEAMEKDDQMEAESEENEEQP